MSREERTAAYIEAAAAILSEGYSISKIATLMELFSEEVYDDAYLSGYDLGYDSGYDTGYEEGREEGISQPKDYVVRKCRGEHYVPDY